MNSITIALKQLADRQPDVATARAYYAGQHPLVFAGERFERHFSRQFASLRDNLSGAVVDAIADRLQITGFGGDDTAVAAADTLWVQNKLARQTGELHLEAGRSGDAAVIVWPDATGTVRIHTQRADQVSFVYDPEVPGRILVAVKVWRELDKSVRVNAYFADRIERYVYRAEHGGLPTDAEKLIPLADDPVVSNPWGTVPVFHFPANAGVGEAGRSDLADVIPLQDALNKTLADLMVAQEYVALPQRARIGVEPRFDDHTGRPVPPAQGPGAVWDIANEAASVSQFASPEVTQLVGAAEALRMEIARVARVPAHLLGLTNSNFPSGEALRVAERPLVARVHDRQVAWGEVWADALHLALRMAGLPDQVADSVVVEWEDPAPVSETEKISNAETLRRIGVPLGEVLRFLGYADEQIDTVLTEAGAESDVALERAQTALDRGLL
jgi:hypothetical protein